MAGIKIVDLPALGRDLVATDLLELSLAGGTGSRKITGQEIINASKLNVGTTPIINGTAGRILFQSTSNTLQQNGNLFWDATNNRLGIGTSTPLTPFDVIATDATILLRNTSSSGYAGINMLDDTNTLTGSFQIGGSGVGSGLAGNMFIGARKTNGNLLFVRGSAATISATLFGSTGNFAIGTNTDAGFRLDVNGTARVSGNFNIATGFELNFNNQNVGLYRSSNNLRLGGFGAIEFLSSATTIAAQTIRMTLFNTGNLAINTTTDDGFKLDVNGTARVSGTVTLNNTSGTNRSTDIRLTNSSDSFPTATLYPTSGTNVGQNFQIIPRGTGLSSNIKAQWVLSGTDLIADGTNFEAIVARATGTAFTFATGKGGTGTIRPILFSAGFLDTVTNPNQLWLYSTGNVGINTTTDAGFRLDVNGTGRVQGRLDLGNASTDGLLYSSPSVAMRFGGGQTTNTFIFRQINSGAFSPSALDQALVNLAINQAESTNNPNRGSVISISGTINNTGINSYVYRGIYYNPTVTSLTNTQHYAFHSTAGRVRFEGLPTSPTGLNAGDIYNDGGTLKIV